MSFDTCCRIFLLFQQQIAGLFLSMTSNASCEQLEEGQKKIPKAVSHSIFFIIRWIIGASWLVLTYDLPKDRRIDDVTMKTIWLTYYIYYLIKQIDSMLPCVCSDDIKIWWHTRLRIVCHFLVCASQHNLSFIYALWRSEMFYAERHCSFWMNELPVTRSLCFFANIPGIACGQTLQVARQKCMAKDVLFWREIFAFSTLLFLKMNLCKVGTREV